MKDGELERGEMKEKKNEIFSETNMSAKKGEKRGRKLKATD